MIGRIVACRTSASIRTITSPPAGAGPGSAASPWPACPDRGRPSAADAARGAPFGGGRIALVLGNDVDLGDLHLAIKNHRRSPSGEPSPKLVGHRLHVRHAE